MQDLSSRPGASTITDNLLPRGGMFFAVGSRVRASRALRSPTAHRLEGVLQIPIGNGAQRCMRASRPGAVGLQTRRKRSEASAA
jgi:hypothetical protein